MKNEESNINVDVSGIPEMVGRKDVFISYKRENAAYVIRLFHELSRNNITAWLDLDRLHRDPGHGDGFAKHIHEAIDKSEYFLLMYTKEVEDSDFIIDDELKYAISKKKRILFFPQDAIDVETSRVYPYVKDIQWLDTKQQAKYQLDTQEAIKDEHQRARLGELTNRNYWFSIFDDENLFLIRIGLQRLLGRVTQFGHYQKICGSSGRDFYNNKTLKLKVLNKGLFLQTPLPYREELTRLKFFNPEKTKDIQNHLETVNPDCEELQRELYVFFDSYSNIYGLDVLYKWLKDNLKKGKNESLNGERDDLDETKYEGLKLPPYEEFERQGYVGFINVVKDMTACYFITEIKSGRTMFNGAELGVYNIIDSRIPDEESHTAEVQLYYSDYFTFKCMTEMYHILCSINDLPFKDINKERIRQVSPFLCSLGLGGFMSADIHGQKYLLWAKRSDSISSGDIWHFSFDETVSLLKDASKENGRIVISENGEVNLNPNEILFRALEEELGVNRELVIEDHFGLFEIGLIMSERLEIELIASCILHFDDKTSPEEKIKNMHDSSSDGYLEIQNIQFIPVGDVKDLIGKLVTPESYAISKRMEHRVFNQTGKKAIIGENTRIEDGCYIDDNAIIGRGCKLHRNVYVGKGVSIGDYVKIQNNNSIYPGVTLEDGVFVGTNVSFTNDPYPRSIRHSDGLVVDASDWKMEKTRVCRGASIGAGAVIRCGVTIGEWAMVGCGAVVTHDVAPYTTVVGNPAHPIDSKEILK